MDADANIFNLTCVFCLENFANLTEFMVHIRLKCTNYQRPTTNTHYKDLGNSCTNNTTNNGGEVVQTVTGWHQEQGINEDSFFDEVVKEEETTEYDMGLSSIMASQTPAIVAEKTTKVTHQVDAAENALADPLAIQATFVKNEPISDNDETGGDHVTTHSQNMQPNKNKNMLKPKATVEVNRAEKLILLRSKKFLLTFIEVLKSTPLLWHAEHLKQISEENQKQQRQKFALTLNSKLNGIEFDEEDVAKGIKYLTTIWRKVTNGQMVSLWFYKHLQFFASANSKKLAIVPTFSRSHYSCLIDEFKIHTILWDHKHKNYLNKFERKMAYADIAHSMNRQFPNIHYTSDRVKRVLDRLITRFRQMSTNKIPKTWFFEKLKFLEITNETELKAIKNVEWTAQQNIFDAVDELVEQTSGKVFKKVDDMLHDLEYTDYFSMSDFSDFEGFSEEESVENDCNNEKLNTESDEIKFNAQPQDNLNYSGIECYEVSLAVIRLFKAQPSLWDRKNINYFRNTEHLRHYKNIAATLNKCYGLKVNPIDVRKRIQHIVDVYRKDYSNSIYAKHLRFLLNDKAIKFSCKYCNKIFEKCSDLMLHVKDMHEKSKCFQCDKCDRSFATSARLKCHQVVHMSKEQLPYLCEKCGENFRSVQTFRSHRSKEHNAKWNFVCDTCTNGFATRAQLISHTRTHTGERPYLCQDCGKAFSALGPLIDHRDRHENRKRYSCNICEKKFFDHSKFKVHKKKHTNTRDYVCDVCGKGFFDRQTLLIHMEIHATTGNYKCQFCDRTFKQRSGRYNHERKQHRLLKFHSIDQLLQKQ